MKYIPFNFISLILILFSMMLFLQRSYVYLSGLVCERHRFLTDTASGYLVVPYVRCCRMWRGSIEKIRCNRPRNRLVYAIFFLAHFTCYFAGIALERDRLHCGGLHCRVVVSRARWRSGVRWKPNEIGSSHRQEKRSVSSNICKGVFRPNGGADSNVDANIDTWKEYFDLNCIIYAKQQHQS